MEARYFQPPGLQFGRLLTVVLSCPRAQGWVIRQIAGSDSLTAVRRILIRYQTGLKYLLVMKESPD